MADYGHELVFGTFLTPQAANPESVVALAQLTERAGLELATFQDHPYQSAFLDTWTLMTWVAANTETLKISPNVLNVPLRLPSVVARSAASLDLLSKGRFELGLGAGGFWDPIVAMGGPRRTPGEGVTALSEAIDIIRQLWDVTTRRGVRVDGEHYKVIGAKRGPEPAHEIPIHLGAYKPRMLRLTGEKADGWLPSQAYMQPGDFAPANARIDAAAEAVGRDPREIRRMLNVNTDDVDQLVELALEHGFSTFILGSDDPYAIERFGQDVAPAVREAVATERAARGTATGPFGRSPAVRAQRLPGIDYDAAPVAAVEPGDRAYGKVRSSYSYKGSPGLVLQPKTAEEVSQALIYAREQDVPLAIRSGGHGISGRSTNEGGVVIDLGALNGIQVVGDKALLGPGARWGHVAAELGKHGLGMSSGDYGDVGVGGLATTGGVGFMSRLHGLTIDHVTGARVVLADGRIVDADEELLWALRGAGANFGIVTEFELEPYPVGNVVFSSMAFDASRPAEVLTRWGYRVENAPRELTSFLNLVTQQGGPVAQLYSVYAGEDTDAAIEALTPLLDIAPVLDQQAQLVPYPAVVAPRGGLHMGGSPTAVRAGLATHLYEPTAQALEDLLATRESSWLQVRAVGGAVNDMPADATAYAHRTQNFSVNAVGRSSIERLNAAWDEHVYPHMDGLYLSFDTDPRPERLLDAFPEPTLSRLRELKAKYDPDNVFRQNFAIEPAGSRIGVNATP
ncbi:LLM class flavin-dependent oxidoreductase [Solirubrobacter sp. CPCC 204708]|uniref:LLM class flavin-dependent oxidoreductase n=1 Tax=Solirubrobacter deserti TaxID=2282478 RepID=A0ABT4RLV3_9ACTN|nr:LLM class flavin-dependent oxidoreductase [Solirubrobacter deserti]MBE2314386.1 LLM class flavin-dependent oxidoreductase [Solirubrobacter deserti]MDA0139533.1 LLM class flavin-dependent oxidoreductase [Solirubrobacter deserti]